MLRHTRSRARESGRKGRADALAWRNPPLSRPRRPLTFLRFYRRLHTAFFTAPFFPPAVILVPLVRARARARRRRRPPSRALGTDRFAAISFAAGAPLNPAAIVNPRRHRPGIRAANDAPRKIGAYRIARRPYPVVDVKNRDASRRNCRAISTVFDARKRVHIFGQDDGRCCRYSVARVPPPRQRCA